jgi:iron complex outermembrane receptor protein
MATTHCFPLGIALLAAASATSAQSSDPGRTEEMPRVTISGRAPNPATEPAAVTEFDDSPLGKTPASVSVVNTRELREAGARSLSSVARSEPSVSDAYNTVGFIETLQVRGFVLDSILNYRRNGLPVSNYSPLALENKDRLEILKGLDGAVSGTSSPGGLINYVTKRPAAGSLREVNAEVSERGTWTVAGDLSERAGPFGYRFNIATEERRPNARDAPGDRRFAAGAVELKLPREGIFEFEVEWQRARQISVPGFGLLARDGDSAGTILPPPIDPRINLNNQPWSLPFESHDVVGTVRYEQPINSTLRLGVRALAQRILTNDRIAFPDGCSTQSVYVYPGLCENYNVDIYDYRSNHEIRTTHSSEAYAILRFDTAGVGHRLQFGARATRYAERLPPRQAYNFVGTTNVFAPVDLPADPALTVLNTNRDLSLDEAYLYDALKFGASWSAWLGARYVQVENRSALSDGSQSAAFSKDIVTPWAAVGWQPWAGGFLYVSTGTGIEAEVVPNRPLDFANAGQVLPVGRSRQIEVGYKQAFGAAANVSVALFQIRKPYSASVIQLSGPPVRVADGRIAQHRGAEIALSGFIERYLVVDLQATYLDASNDQSIDPTLVGKRVTNVPKFAASLGTSLRPSQEVDLQWRNRVGYTGTKAVTPDNSVVLPASWQWDTALVWSPATAKPHLQLRAGVDNVTDRRYWREAPTQPWGATYLFPAQPRTYRVGMTATW